MWAHLNIRCRWCRDTSHSSDECPTENSRHNSYSPVYGAPTSSGTPYGARKSYGYSAAPLPSYFFSAPAPAVPKKPARQCRFCRSTDHVLKDCAEYLRQLDEDDEPDIRIVPTPHSGGTPSTSGYVSLSPSHFEGYGMDTVTGCAADLCTDIAEPILHVHPPLLVDSILSPVVHTTLVSDDIVDDVSQEEAGDFCVTPVPMEEDNLLGEEEFSSAPVEEVQISSLATADPAESCSIDDNANIILLPQPDGSETGATPPILSLCSSSTLFLDPPSSSEPVQVESTQELQEDSEHFARVNDECILSCEEVDPSSIEENLFIAPSSCCLLVDDSLLGKDFLCEMSEDQASSSPYILFPLLAFCKYYYSGRGVAALSPYRYPLPTRILEQLSVHFLFHRPIS